MTSKLQRNVLTTAISTALIASTPIVAKAQQGVLEEVLVTATRRAQSVQDVPYNISALTGEDLEKAGISDAAELFNAVSGVNFVEMGPRSGVNSSNLMIRGINAEDTARNSGPLQTAPVVSIYVNETPIFVNLRMNDLERVEILRGPQGTLYGSGSLGGSVRYIYNKPDFESFHGEVKGGLGSTKNGDGLNYEADLILNFPVSDTFAIRFAGGYVNDAGFIDQPRRYVRNPDGSPVLDNGSTDPFNDSANFFAGQPVYESADGVNDAKTKSARVALRWAPNDSFEANLSYDYQDDEVGGTQMNSYFLFGEDSLDNAALIEEPFERKVNLLALDVDFDMGFASFTGSASTYKNKGTGSRDLTGFYEQFSFYESYYGTSPRPLVEDISSFDDQGNVFEVRLVSQGDSAVDWVIGAFYMDQDLDLSANQFFYGYDDYANSCFIETDTFGGAPCGFGTLWGIEETNGPVTIVKDEAYLIDQTNDFRDLAFFGELTWHVTDKWQITGGTRYYDQKFNTTQVGGLEFAPDGVTSRTLENKDDGFLFKFNTSYQINDTTNIYAVWSEGFRRGGANGLPDEAFGSPVNPKSFLYKSDETKNLEVGIKGWLSDRYTYTFAYYDIDWDDLQANLACTGLGLLCVVNAGDASSKGVEGELQGQVTDNLEINLGYTYIDSELKSLSPTLIEFIEDGTLFADVVPGVSLPGASKHNISMGGLYSQQLSNGMELRYGLNGSYRSKAESSLYVDSYRLDSFWLWNANITLVADNWTLRAFINNIGDERGLLGADPVDQWGPRANAVISMPRTFGLHASYRF